MVFPGVSVVKNLPVKQEMWVQSLGWEDSLEKEMATHSSALAWEIPWTEDTSGLEFMGSNKRVGHGLANDHTCNPIVLIWNWCLHRVRNLPNVIQIQAAKLNLGLLDHRTLVLLLTIQLISSVSSMKKQNLWKKCETRRPKRNLEKTWSSQIRLYCHTSCQLPILPAFFLLPSFLQACIHPFNQAWLSALCVLCDNAVLAMEVE